MKKRWKLFHATDFQSLMYPCFFYCGILGIFPYKINASNFEISKLRYILITISEMFSSGNITRTFENFCFLTLNGFIAIVTYILSKPRMHLLQTILNISLKLSTESYKKLSRWIHIKDIFGVIILVVQEYMYFNKVQIFEKNYWTALMIAIIMYLVLLEFQMNQLHVNCICVLKACFKKINDDLIHKHTLTINNEKLPISNLICHMSKNQFFLEELKSLMKQYLILTKTVQMLNRIFSLQLLAIVILSFIEITVELYFYLVRWQGEVLITFDEYFLDVFLTSMMYYIIKVMFIVWACETGKNEIQKISTIIYDVHNSTRDKQIKNKLQLFSLQILHCKNTFSTKGLTVDATLVATMVGGITTYMLILIQFLITTSHSCDGNLTIDCMDLRSGKHQAQQIITSIYDVFNVTTDEKVKNEVVYRILGMFPYKISASTFDASKTWYTLSTIVICICGIYDIMLIHTLIYKVNFGDMTKNLQAILYYMCSSFIIIITHILSVPRMRLLQTILKISKLPSKSYENLSKFIHVKDILGTIFVIMQIYIYFPKTEMFNSLNSLTRVLTAYQVIVVFQTNMLYINCVYVLKACFKNINDNLTHIQRLMINDTRPLCVSILMSNIKRSLLIELKALKKRHLMLISIMYYVTQMMLLVWICETGKNQAQQIRTTIHDLLNNTSDKQIKDELQLFSLQLLHCNNIFSAKSLNVDATLFATVKMKIADQKMPWLHHAKQKSHVISSRDFSESHPPVACGEKSPRDHVIELREISYYKEGRSMSISNYIRSFEIKFVESTLTRILYRLMYYIICDKSSIMFNLSSSFQGGSKRKKEKIEWRMFHAKDFRSLMQPCFILCRIFGIFPYKINVTSFEISKPYLILLIMDMLYMNCVCVLKACFTRINDNLMSMRRFIANNESRVHTLNYHNHRNPFLIMELKALKIQHLTISDTVQMLNIIFSLQLLATIVMTLFTITICLYFYILAAKHFLVNVNFFMNISFHTFFLQYVTYFFIKILLIVWACETGKAQAQQISISIHDVFNVTTDKKIKDEVIY
ncbi:Putative gustatory receptor 28b [Atta colombica]|uniref:Putative gustatory receptor 28b n=1 Tax=Atta colombica TaxID=520822 RepID=A0A195ATN8_9HYME|nr:Putative gustatory receptor 28b [Atta colombica]